MLKVGGGVLILKEYSSLKTGSQDDFVSLKPLTILTDQSYISKVTFAPSFRYTLSVLTKSPLGGDFAGTPNFMTLSMKSIEKEC